MKSILGSLDNIYGFILLITSVQTLLLTHQQNQPKLFVTKINSLITVS